jgi:hypothetical protein
VLLIATQSKQCSSLHLYEVNETVRPSSKGKVDEPPSVRLLYKVNLECTSLTDFDLLRRMPSGESEGYLQSIATVENSKLRVYNLPVPLQHRTEQKILSLKAAEQVDLGE